MFIDTVAINEYRKIDAATMIGPYVRMIDRVRYRLLHPSEAEKRLLWISAKMENFDPDVFEWSGAHIDDPVLEDHRALWTTLTTRSRASIAEGLFIWKS